MPPQEDSRVCPLHKQVHFVHDSKYYELTTLIWMLSELPSNDTADVTGRRAFDQDMHVVHDQLLVLCSATCTDVRGVVTIAAIHFHNISVETINYHSHRISAKCFMRTQTWV
jgi:hypothetical protein